jgi:putative transposase
VQGYFAARKAGTGRRRGFPVFKKRGRSKASFRVRNKSHEVRTLEHGIRLPKVGVLAVRESTRRLLRMLRIRANGEVRAKICFATVVQVADRWHVRINVEAASLHPSLQHAPGAQAAPALGIDRGLCAFAVGATADGEERLRVLAPKPLAKNLRTLRRASRGLSRCRAQSKGRGKARRKLARLHARIGRIRNHFVHTLSSRVIKTHAHVALEDLHVSGMLRNRHLSRSISDVAWGRFAAQVAYKAAWHNGRVTVVDRWFPSSKRCHGCGHVVSELPLSQRQFVCPQCRLTCDRDTNAAANCAQQADKQNVAAKRVETKNARGGGGSGRSREAVVKPTSVRREKRGHSRPRPTPEKGGVGLNVTRFNSSCR